ncbi:MAG: hypothetical protein ACT4QF_00180 [Sporichthyaceae bacterium]|jgi:hypothetical protein
MSFLGLTAEPAERVSAIEVDRINVGLALVNWCFLLLLMCALLLAKTLPSNTALTSGFSAEDCTTATCQTEMQQTKQTKK